MNFKNISLKIKEKASLLKNIKWTRKKIAAVAGVVLLMVTSLFFLSGAKEEYAYIKVTEGPYAEKIVAVGQMGMENQTAIISQVSGKVELVEGIEGETVTKGSILLSLYNPDQEAQKQQKESAYLDAKEQYDSLVQYDYALAKEELNRADLSRNQAQKIYLDAQLLYKEGAISKNSLTDFELAYQGALLEWSSAKLKVDSLGPSGTKRSSLLYKLESVQSAYENALSDEAKYKIAADWDAVILAAYVSEGDTVKPGDLLLDVGQAERYTVLADLDEKYFLYVSKGMKAGINLEGQPKSEQLEGEISVVSPKINKNTGTFQVEIKVLSDISYNASDLTVNLEILLKQIEKAILVPKQYLLENEDYLYLYINGNAKKVKVEIERGPSSNVIVKSGIKQGDIVLLPVPGLSDGQSVSLKKGVDPA